MIIYKANFTGKYSSEEMTKKGVKIAPIIESGALDEYEGAWSAVILENDGAQMKFSFLAVDAPRVIKAGDSFTLREGSKITAEGVITEIYEEN